MGEPLKPFEQLLACLPPSSAFQLPKRYRWLMTDPTSPISDFYPKSFSVDMNGKRWHWEAVALLPFVDKERLLKAVTNLKRGKKLTAGELRRNRTGDVVVIEQKPIAEAETTSIAVTPFDSTKWRYDPRAKPVFEPRLTPGVTVPLPGFATLRCVPIKKLRKEKLGINVFNSRSRYATVLLVTNEDIPEIPPLDETLARNLNEQTVLINFPFFTEALVTATSNSTVEYRGRDNPRFWSENESSYWEKRFTVLNERHASGEGFSGSGGWRLPTTKEAVKLSVRPFRGFKTLKDGTVAKLFVPFEIEVPLVSAIWAPEHPDPRVATLPYILEEDPFHMPLLHWQPSLPKDSASQDVSVLPTEDALAAGLGSTSGQEGSSLVGTVFGDSFSYQAASGLRLLPKSETVVPTEATLLTPMQMSVLPFRDKLGNEGTPATSEYFPTLASDGGETSSAVAAATHREPTFLNGNEFPLGTAKLPDDVGTPDTQIPLLPGKGGHQHEAEIGNSALLRSLNSLKNPKEIRKVPPRNRLKSTRNKRQVVALPTKRNYSTSSFLVAPRPRGPIQNKMVFLGFAVVAALGAKLVNGVRPVHLAGSSLSELSFRERPVEESPSSVYGGFDLHATPALELAHGTTTLSFTFKGGIIAAVDSRATLGTFVGSKTTQKVLPVNS